MNLSDGALYVHYDTHIEFQVPSSKKARAWRGFGVLPRCAELSEAQLFSRAF